MRLFVFIGLMAVCLGAMDYNLLSNGDFKPVRMNPGEVTAVKDWIYWDEGRYQWNTSKAKTLDDYLDGHSCFDLLSGPQSFGVRFRSDLPEKYGYYGKQFTLNNAYMHKMLIPAASFRLHGFYRCLNTRLSLSFKNSSCVLQPTTEWREIDWKIPGMKVLNKTSFTIRFISQPGAEVELKSFSLIPEYPEASRGIPLEEGGELREILIPKNADITTRTGAAYWRGWLWRLSGVALPIHEAETVTPRPGALSIDLNLDSSCGFDLISSPGQVALSCADRFNVRVALFEYLRRFGFRAYAFDAMILPDRMEHFVFRKATMKIRPHFATINRNFHSNQDVAEIFGGSGWALDNVSSIQGDMYFGYNGWQDNHNAPMLLPITAYGKKHPEYYSKRQDGTPYPITARTIFNHQCTSNPEVRKIALERLRNYLRSCDEGERLFVEATPGDGLNHCRCPHCLALSPNPSSISQADIQMDYVNYIARGLREEFPKIKVCTFAYCAQLMEPPRRVKPEPNVVVYHCSWPSDNQCQLHAQCPISDARFNKLLLEWEQLMGKERIGCMIYHNPLYVIIDRLNFLSQHASLMLCHFLNTSWGHTYVISRWNMGDDPYQALAEFCDAYYGKGGKAMAEAYAYVGKVCKEYKHLPNEKNLDYIEPYSRFHRYSIFKRENYNELYRIVDKALSLESTPKMRQRILYMKMGVLTCDISLAPLSAHTTPEDIQAFNQRVVTLLTTANEMLAISRQYPFSLYITRMGYNRTPRGFLSVYAGIDLPETSKKSWIDEELVQQIVKNPQQFIQSRLSIEPVTIQGGKKWLPKLLAGGEAVANGNEMMRVLRRASSKKGKVTASFTLKQLPEKPCQLTIFGVDDDKPGKTQWHVSVNGHPVTTGKIPFPNSNGTEENQWVSSNWKPWSVQLQPSVLKKGKNLIVVENRTPDSNALQQMTYNDGGVFLGAGKQQDYRWGWFAIKEIRLMDTH